MRCAVGYAQHVYGDPAQVILYGESASGTAVGLNVDLEVVAGALQEDILTQALQAHR